MVVHSALNNQFPQTRFDWSDKYSTHFSVGHDAPSYKTIYEKDYGAKVSRQVARFPQLPKSIDRVTDPVKKLNVKKTTARGSQRTNFTFGNDDMAFNTVYAGDYRNASQSAYRLKCVSPQPCAEILPSNNIGLSQSKPIDYCHFGQNVSSDVYADRRASLRQVKDIHTRDSVRLDQKPRKLITRAMVDYQRPLDRLHGGIKLVVVQNITPNAREDSIWQSVNNGGQFQMISEARQAYRWPLAGPPCQRHCRACHAKSA